MWLVGLLTCISVTVRVIMYGAYFLWMGLVIPALHDTINAEPPCCCTSPAVLGSCMQVPCEVPTFTV